MTARTIALVAAIAAITAILPASAVAATADLAIDKTDSADPATVGAEFSYELAVSNKGPEEANGVQVEDTLPNQLDFVAANPSQGSCKQQGRKVTCDLATIANGGGATITIRVTPRKAGQIVNSATVTTTDADPVDANNTDTETTNVVEPPTAPQCAGREATIIGTAGDDQLTGTAKKDVIVALAGNDTILGLGGDDLVCSAAGNDTIKGAAGNDELRAGGGNDSLKGGDGNDLLRAGGGSDRLGGGRGADALRGGGGVDRCKGGPGRDTKKSC